MGPSAGATAVFGILGLLERFDLTRSGKDKPVAGTCSLKASASPIADRDGIRRDSDFVSVPVAGLTDPAYLRDRARLIARDRAYRQAHSRASPGRAPRAAP